MTTANSFFISLKLLTVLVLVLVSACSPGDTVSIPSLENPNRVWGIQSNVRSLNLVQGDEFQIIVNPKDANGNILTLRDDDEVTYRSEFARAVRIDSVGKVSAEEITAGVRIFASIRSGGIFFTDTINVVVHSAPSTLESVEITSFGFPLDPMVTYKSYKWFDVTVKDNNGVKVNDLAYSARSLDETIITASPWAFFGKNAGKAKVVVDVHAFGQFLSDTIELKVIYPSSISVYLSSSSSAIDNVIAANGKLTFVNYFYPSAAIDIIFDPDNPAPISDVTGLSAYMSEMKTFVVPGVYKFSIVSAIGKGSLAKGAVFVRENPTF